MNWSHEKLDMRVEKETQLNRAWVSLGLANYFCSHTSMHPVISSLNPYVHWHVMTPLNSEFSFKLCDRCNKTVEVSKVMSFSIFNVISIDEKSLWIMFSEMHIGTLLSMIHTMVFYEPYKNPYNPFPNSNATDDDLYGSNNKHFKIGN